MIAHRAASAVASTSMRPFADAAVVARAATCRQARRGVWRQGLATSTASTSTSRVQSSGGDSSSSKGCDADGITTHSRRRPSPHTSSLYAPHGMPSLSAPSRHHRVRSFTASARQHAPPPASQPEPAVSRPMDTPPSPFPTGKLKQGTQESASHASQHREMPMSPPEPAAQPEAQSSSTPKSSSTDKDEACQTLSPSSPSAPRSQGQQSSQKAPFEARQEELGVGEEQTGKAIPPEIVNKPSVGRKGGSRFKAQKAALTLVRFCSAIGRATLFRRRHAY